MSLNSVDPMPLEDRLIIRMLEPDEEVRTPSGIIIPKEAHEKTMFGVVMYHGPGRYTFGGVFQRTVSQKDDVVLVGKLAGTDYVLGGIKYLVIREADAQVIWPSAGGAYDMPEEKRAGGVDQHLKTKALYRPERATLPRPKKAGTADE